MMTCAAQQRASRASRASDAQAATMLAQSPTSHYSSADTPCAPRCAHARPFGVPVTHPRPQTLCLRQVRSAMGSAQRCQSVVQAITLLAAEVLPVFKCAGRSASAGPTCTRAHDGPRAPRPGSGLLVPRIPSVPRVAPRRGSLPRLEKGVYGSGMDGGPVRRTRSWLHACSARLMSAAVRTRVASDVKTGTGPPTTTASCRHDSGVAAAHALLLGCTRCWDRLVSVQYCQLAQNEAAHRLTSRNAGRTTTTASPGPRSRLGTGAQLTRRRPADARGARVATAAQA